MRRWSTTRASDRALVSTSKQIEALAQVAEGWQGMEKFTHKRESPETSGQREYVRNWSRRNL